MLWALALSALLIRFLVVAFQAEEWIGVLLAVAALVLVVLGPMTVWITRRRP